MAWTIEYGEGVEKTLRKLGQPAAKRILTGLEAIVALGSPRERGKAMVGNHSGHWRYRFGDYRVIARLEDDRLVVLVIAAGHRREIYR